MSSELYPSAGTIRRHVLPNGIIVLLYHNRFSGTVVMEGSLWAGSSGETRQNAGLAGFTASMLQRGAGQRTFDEIYEQLEGVGGRLGFASGYQLTEFSAESLVEDFDLVLELTADALRRPTFPADQMEKVRAEKMTGIMMRENDTGSMARLAFNELLYGDHPYGRSVTGYADTVSAITRDDVAGFHATHYGPQGMVITVVGGLAPDAALASVERAFGDWENRTWTPCPPLPAVERPTETRYAHVPMPDKTQSDIMLGLPGPLRSAPDYMDAKLANTVLGVFGMMGRLGKEVREKQGLAYYARSVLQGTLGPRPWYVSTGVAPDKVKQALTTIQAEIRRIQEEPVPDDELADSKAFLIGSLPMAIETNRGIASIVGDLELFSLDFDYLINYPDMINAISVEQVQAATRRYFSADHVAIAVAGPPSEDA